MQRPSAARNRCNCNILSKHHWTISSGLGTIGTREFCFADTLSPLALTKSLNLPMHFTEHLAWGKCPFVQPEIVQRMIETKKISNLQTRTNFRVGLDAYCRKLAKWYGIINDKNSIGISWVEGTQSNFDDFDDDIVLTDNHFFASVLASRRVIPTLKRAHLSREIQNTFESATAAGHSYSITRQRGLLYTVYESPRGRKLKTI